MTNIIQKIKSIKSHPGANASLLRIGINALPYYFNNTGFSFSPLTIYISVNSVCNLRCKMCDVGQKVKESTFYKNLSTNGKSELSVERLKELVNELKEFKFKPFISINSTEPLLYSGITEISEYIVKNGLKLQITTNGYLLEKFAEDFVRIGVQRIWVSLDGPPKIHNEMRGVKDSFEKATVGIKAINKQKRKLGSRYPQLFSAYAITNYNYHCLEQYMESIKDLNFEHIVFSHMNFVTPEIAIIHNQKFGNICRANPTSIADANPNEVDVKVLYEQIKKVKKKYNSKVSFMPDLDFKDLQKFYYNPEVFVLGTKCQTAWAVVQIIANGDLVPLSRCFNIPLGNINESSFKELWNGEKMREFRKTIKKYGTFPACSRCCGVL